MNSTACIGSTETVSANTGTNAAIIYTWVSTPAGPAFSTPGSSTTTIYFPSAGTYTIGLGVLFSTGFSYTNNVITILAGPPITVSQTSGTTCIASNLPKYSKPIVLVASGASSYAWFPYGIGVNGATNTARPAVSTCYTVYGYNTIGCPGVAVACVTVKPQFTFEVSPASGIRCIPDSLKLNIVNIHTLGISPYTYSWTENMNAPPISISNNLTPTVKVFPQNNTTYSIEVGDAAGCVSQMAVVNVSVQNCTGIFTNTHRGINFSLRPNPTNGKLVIVTEGVLESLMEIRNLTGSVVFNTLLPLNQGKKEHEIDLANLDNGIYFISLATGAGKMNQKIILDK